ncbi:MAG: hypothetical protein AAFU41_08800 [Pseudomonadota bacterium]
MTKDQVFDPKGLIREAFAIEGISEGEARSIFLDWALGVPADRDTQAEVQRLLQHYTTSSAEDHPMLKVLRAALADKPAPRRRGGRAGRLA